MQSGVFDGDPGMEGEHLDEALVILGEVTGRLLVGQVQPPDRSTFRPDRDAQQRVHLGVVRWEAVAARVRGNVVDADRTSLECNHTKEPEPVWRRPDPLAVGTADAAGYESLEPVVLVHDAQGCVLGVDQLADAVRNELQDSVQIQDAGDAPRGRIERRQLVGGLSGTSL